MKAPTYKPPGARKLLGAHRSGRLLWLTTSGKLGWSFADSPKVWKLEECYSWSFLAWACELIFALAEGAPEKRSGR